MFKIAKPDAHALTILLICGGLLTICIAQTASAQMPGGGMPQGGMMDSRTVAPNPFRAAFLRWDINHDGVVTCDEWRATARRLFAGADKNRDGFLDPTEFRALGRADPLFADASHAYFDTNNDGRVSLAEFVDMPSQLFTRFDTNRDCRVTMDELEGRKPEPTPGRGLRGGGGQGGGMGGGQGSGMGGGMGGRM